MKKITIILLFITALLSVSCADEDSFTTSPVNRLTFSVDTVRMDTLFSNVPSATKSFWVYNFSGDGLRCKSVRLENGSSSGFRVNVDGIYLGEGRNYETDEVEIRNKDSVRVLVETTLPTASVAEPTLTADNLVFTLESGVEQKVNLTAFAWNARLLKNVRISRDSTISSNGTPTVIYGGLRVDSGATLTIAPGTQLYFHADAALNVYGRLLSRGTAENNVVLRGDRIDRMFDYLPYDRVPAQWMGVHLYSSSYDNEIIYTDIHSTNNGIEIDSSDISKQKLTLSHATVHNCQGYGLHAIDARLTIEDSQLTNTLYDCLHIDGGYTEINGCTLAQFYPFDSRRGAAFAMSDANPILNMIMRNSLVTGYADNVFMATVKDTAAVKNWKFEDCIVRTPKPTTRDSLLFSNVIYENVKDTTTMGEKHFQKIDIDNLVYDFRLKETSAAVNKGNKATALSDDRNGIRRDDKPDIGAYEYTK